VARIRPQTDVRESLRLYTNLKIHYSDLLKNIRGGDPLWETMVPPSVAKLIKDGKLFSYGGGNEE
jgi:hypothetical protein